MAGARRRTLVGAARPCVSWSGEPQQCRNYEPSGSRQPQCEKARRLAGLLVRGCRMVNSQPYSGPPLVPVVPGAGSAAPVVPVPVVPGAGSAAPVVPVPVVPGAGSAAPVVPVPVVPGAGCSTGAGAGTEAAGRCRWCRGQGQQPRSCWCRWCRGRVSSPGRAGAGGTAAASTAAEDDAAVVTAATVAAGSINTAGPASAVDAAGGFVAAFATIRLCQNAADKGRRYGWTLCNLRGAENVVPIQSNAANLIIFIG